jgi:hypothetical protein
LQGYFSHSKQKPDLLFLIVSQFLMIHLKVETIMLVLSPWQPGHFFFFSKISAANTAIHPAWCNQQRFFFQLFSPKGIGCYPIIF